MSATRDFLFELLAVFIGVLLAVSLGSLSDRLDDRATVRKARETLALEINANLQELRTAVNSFESRDRKLAEAERFADEVLESGTSEIVELELGFALAELSSAAWQTASALGALAQMDFEEVRDLAQIYQVQDLVTEQQRRSVDRLSQTVGFLTSGKSPMEAPRDDLLGFRQEVRAMRSEMVIERQVAERLLALYESAALPDGSQSR